MHVDGTAADHAGSRMHPARRRMPAIPVRAIVFIGVVAAHVSLLILWPKLHGRGAAAVPDETPSILVFLPPIESQQSEPSIRLPDSPSTARRARREKSSLELASKPPIVEPESSSAAVAIDWSREAELAVSRQIDADEEAARKARAFSAPTAPAGLAAAPAQNPQFGWSHARTHRVESMPGGGFIINLNDQCALVVMIMLMPVCKIGKIEARGDLFLHIDDPPLLGDWDTKLP